MNKEERQMIFESLEAQGYINPEIEYTDEDLVRLTTQSMASLRVATESPLAVGLKEMFVEKGLVSPDDDLDEGDLLELVAMAQEQPSEESSVTPGSSQSDNSVAMAMARDHVEKVPDGTYTIYGSEREITMVNGKEHIRYFPTRRRANGDDVIDAKMKPEGLVFVLCNGSKEKVEM